jgi:hypothetical protein
MMDKNLQVLSIMNQTFSTGRLSAAVAKPTSEKFISSENDIILDIMTS